MGIRYFVWMCYCTLCMCCSSLAFGQAGNDTTITVCRNASIDLNSLLSGNVDANGSWLDPNLSAIDASIQTANFPGFYDFRYVVLAQTNLSDTAIITIQVEGCDALATNTLENDVLRVFPNPVTDYLKIDFKAEELIAVNIRDGNGRLLETITFNNEGQIGTVSFQHLEPGMYQLIVEVKSGLFVTKIIKQ